MSPQRNMKKKVEQQLQNYLDQYAKRAREEKPTDVFGELNAKWVKFCDQVKRPLMKEAFAVAVTELNKTVSKIDQRKRSELFWGRVAIWFFIIITTSWVGGIAFLVWFFFIQN